MTGAWIPNPEPFPSAPPDRWPTPPPFPPPPPGPSPGRGRGGAVAILAVALAFAVLVVGAIGWAVRRDDSRPDVATSTSSSTTSTTGPSSPSSSTTEAPPTTAPQSLEEALGDLIAFVEAERGHRFKERPRVEAIDPAVFDAKLRADLDRRRSELATEQVTLRALGQIEPGTDLVEVYRSLLEAGVVGFYDPETKELFVQGTTVTAYRRAVIVHELTHALDDQYFDLGRTTAFDRRSDESGFGFLSIVEGSAKRVENAYRRSLSATDRAALAAEEAQLATGVNPFDLPIAVQLRQALPYLSGERLVQEVIDARGIGALDRAFGDPPTTSEQVLDPSVFRARERALPVTTPSADGPVVDSGAFGVVDVQLTLLGTDPLGALDAFEPIDGWGGGRFVAWNDGGGRSCVRFRLVGDTPADTAALGNQLSDWAGRRGAELGRAGGGELEVTRCA